MPWLRLWTDILDSEKIGDLDDATLWGWALILLATKKFNQDGLLPPLKKMAYWLRRPEASVDGWLKKLVKAGLIEKSADGLRAHDWNRWQEPKDHTNSFRQAKHRGAKKSLSALSPETDSETDSETERETDSEGPVTAAPLPAAVTPLLPRSDVSFWDDRQQQCVDLATRRWGASNGDVIVGDLLRSYSAEIVMESIDQHWDKVGQAIAPALLRSTCKGKHEDQRKRLRIGGKR